MLVTNRKEKQHLAIASYRIRAVRAFWFFAQWSLHFLRQRASSGPPHSEGENQRVGGLACKAGKTEAHLWGLTVSPNLDIMLCSQAGPQQTCLECTFWMSIFKCEPQQTPMSYKLLLVKQQRGGTVISCSSTPHWAMNSAGIKTRQSRDLWPRSDSFSGY